MPHLQRCWFSGLKGLIAALQLDLQALTWQQVRSQCCSAAVRPCNKLARLTREARSIAIFKWH